MNQEPVAYLMVDRNDGNSYIQIGVPTRDEKISHQPYPLYNHPIKELIDEEILQVLKSVDADTQRLPTGFKLFAKAILKKASEK